MNKNTTPSNKGSKRNSNDISQKSLGKLDSMLERFALGQNIHRFAAERFGDHCLPTTVSDLQRRNNIFFARELVKVPNRFGSESPVMLYWLEGENKQKAMLIVSKARDKCGLPPLSPDNDSEVVA